MATTPRPGPERSPGGWFVGPGRRTSRPTTGAGDGHGPRRRYRAARAVSPRSGIIQSGSRGSRGSGCGRDLDLARDDLLLVVVDLATGRGVVDAAGLEVVDLVARDVGARGTRLEEVVDRHVDLLDHRGEDDVADVRRGRQGLVGVDTDGELASSLGGREDTAARAARGVVDHVGAALVEALSGRLALGGVVEAGEVRRLREVLALDDDRRVGRLGASDVARLELLDEVGGDAPDEADRVGLGLQRGGRTDEEGALLLGEGQLGDVGAGRVGGRVVDDRELDVGVGLGDRADGLGVGEADTDDVGRARVDELLQTLLGGSLALTVDLRGLLELDTEVGLRLVEAHGRRRVEGLVTTTADAVGDTDDDLLAGGLRAGAAGRGVAARGRVVAAAAAGREAQRGGGDNGRDLGCVTQEVPLRFRGADDDIGPDSTEL